MILFSAHRLSKSYGVRPLFSDISFSLNSGERVGLIGPNGAGKSTLLKIIAGRTEADSGQLSRAKSLRVGYLEQVPSFQTQSTVESTVLEGALDAHDSREQQRAFEIMAMLQLSEGAVTPTALVSTLSGGWQKRVALARELLREPDLLLLDEPTNHLDVESILWLEKHLARARFATLTITHDRLFLQRISTRILELDRRNPQGLISVEGDYATYLEVKEGLIAAQEKQETKLRNTLRRETEWLRRGAKARTTKQQARIDRHAELSDSVEDLAARNQSASVRLDFQAQQGPKKLIEARGLAKSYDGREVVPPLDLLITRQSRLGLLGPNGSGKSTLIRLLLGQEKADQGELRLADGLKVAHFEQNRQSLDPLQTVLKTVCPQGEYVDFGGNKVHVRSYLSRFLFRPEQVESKVEKLSGGEQARLLLARLMLQEANLLVLDEPTNDLDLETLDVLEEVLRDFGGALILVTHDRYFLDQVAREILAFGENAQGKKEIVRLVGLSQWERWLEEQEEAREAKARRPLPQAAPVPLRKKKLSYKDQRELDGMQGRIEEAEAKLSQLSEESARPETLAQAARLVEISQQMAELQSQIEALYTRWAELEAL